MPPKPISAADKVQHGMMAGIWNRAGDLDSSLWFIPYILCDFRQIVTPLLWFPVEHLHIPHVHICMNWLNCFLSVTDTT